MLCEIQSEKVLIQDTRSSAGTFVKSGGQEMTRLRPLQESEIFDGDIIALGEDCTIQGTRHFCVIFRVVFGRNSLAALQANGGFYDVAREEEEEENSATSDAVLEDGIQEIVRAEYQAIFRALDDVCISPVQRLAMIQRGKHDLISRT